MGQYVVGVDIGGSGIRAAAFPVGRESGGPACMIGVPLSKHASASEILDRLNDHVLTPLLMVHLALEMKVSWRDLVGIGVSVPAVVDPKTEKLTAWILKGLEEFSQPLSETIASRWCVPCKVANDAEAAALAEWRFGAGAQRERMLFFIISTGVGGCFVKNGVPRNGEFGTMVVPTQYTKMVLDNPSSWLEPLINTDWFKSRGPHHEEPKLLAVRARNGDSDARYIFKLMGRTLGFAVSSLINIWRPDIVVLGGGIGANTTDLFLPSCRTVIDQFKYGDWALEIPLVPAKLGKDAGVYGAAALVL